MKLKLTLAMLAFSATAAQADSITAIAAADERFSTLVAAVTAAGLAETLAGPGPFTVFAPVNDAFAALPAGTVETLLKPENKGQLTDILLYHVDDRNLPATKRAATDQSAHQNGIWWAPVCSGFRGSPGFRSRLPPSAP